MIEYTTDLQTAVQLQLVFRSFNRRLETETSQYEPEPVSHESRLHSLLSEGKPKTVSQITEMMGVNNTETYYLLSSLQSRKLVAAIPSRPIKFIAIKKSQPHKTTFREMHDYE